MKISTVLDQIDLGALALPEFQRGYVWNRDQVRSLIWSLYKRHPVGGLLVWDTPTDTAHARGDGTLSPGVVSLLLDGQQRITSLYGIIRGRPPRFFDGKPETFLGLHFHLNDETFEFYAPAKMRGNPLWINVTELMQKGIAPYLPQLMADPALAANVNTYINRLNAIAGIQDVEVHVEKVTGADKTIDVVVDIFNRVNSGGTKLSQGDLALARICASWPEARDMLKRRLDKWHTAGFGFRLEWLLRCVNAMVTGEAIFVALKNVTTLEFQRGLTQSEEAVDYLLNLISGRLGLDHEQVLGSVYSFPVMARYVVKSGGTIADRKLRDKLLYWYVHTILWGRYAGSTETVMNQDLALIDNPSGALDRLVEELGRSRGDLRIQPRDFIAWSRSSRFYPLLYLLTRVCHAQDWCSGLELSQFLLGRLNSLQVHHVFPKGLLYEHGYSRADVNAVANFTFLTQECNLQISDRAPADYLEEAERQNPGTVKTHWIPMDRDLWRVDRYLDFLEARREFLAKAANEFLDSLFKGTVPEVTIVPSVLERQVTKVPFVVLHPDADDVISAGIDWVAEQGLPEGELMYELHDLKTGALLAFLDLAWPDGLQTELSQPVALLSEPDKHVEDAANRAGFRYFSELASFQTYVRREILATEGLAS